MSLSRRSVSPGHVMQPEDGDAVVAAHDEFLERTRSHIRRRRGQLNKADVRLQPIARPRSPVSKKPVTPREKQSIPQKQDQGQHSDTVLGRKQLAYGPNYVRLNLGPSVSVSAESNAGLSFSGRKGGDNSQLIFSALREYRSPAAELHSERRARGAFRRVRVYAFVDGSPVGSMLNFITRYPRLKKLVDLKHRLVDKISHPPVYLDVDLRTFPLGSLRPIVFDSILINAPLQEYALNYPSSQVFQGQRPWTWEELEALPVPSIAATQSFVWIWVGSGSGQSEGLERGRELLGKWGYRSARAPCLPACPS
jgi:MT-A70